MTSRRHNPIHDEGSIEPSPAVCAAIEEMMWNWVETGHVEFHWPMKEQSKAARPKIKSAVYDMYDAMIAWMGPGADSAFLDFYLLEKNSLPEVFGSVYTTNYNYDQKKDRTVPEFGKFANSITCRYYVDYDRDSIVRIRVCEFPAKYETYPPGYGNVCIVFLAAPPLNYRNELMGELAVPWNEPNILPSYFLPPRVVRRP